MAVTDAIETTERELAGLLANTKTRGAYAIPVGQADLWRATLVGPAGTGYAVTGVLVLVNCGARDHETFDTADPPPIGRLIDPGYLEVGLQLSGRIIAKSGTE